MSRSRLSLADVQRESARRTPARAGDAASPSKASPATSPRVSRAPHEVRIIGGQWRRTKLPVPVVEGLRPTPDRVRETLFNWLGQDLDGWRCLDAFAGSGALGFEAASRGASAVTLLERDPRVASGLRALRQRLTAEMVQVEACDALAWMARCAPECFELVFVDPPFDDQVFERAMQAAARVVVRGGWVYLEADRTFDTQAFAGFVRHRHGRAGHVHFHLFQRDEAA